MNESPTVVTRRSEESILSTNKVLKNTYLLLSMTLIFSAIMAAVSIQLNFPPIHWAIQLGGMIGLLMLTNVFKNSAMGLVCVFAFTGFLGLTAGPTINAYLTFFSNGAELVMTAAGGTGVIFLALSGYVLTTRKDFSFMGGFLFVGLIVMVVASLANIFFQVAALQLALSAASILLFSGYILYDTSRIIHGGETNYIMATITLFLDIYIMFMNLLHLLGALSGDD
ncbi:MAG: Bax inhibitor-1/YccA family protein [Proteobacteria bacterium]|nr:Bax inhibitor-1/YccA family protein [Pseudomonadota bacterium]NOG59428.1 Bax inhibitor-1/YccA family protein [Pseudomonadota bacterium]